MKIIGQLFQTEAQLPEFLHREIKEGAVVGLKADLSALFEQGQISRHHPPMGQPPTSGSKKSAAQSYRLSPPPIRQVLFFARSNRVGIFVCKVLFIGLIV